MDSQGFINRLCDWIAGQSNEVRSQALLVLPTRRAMLFIQEALSERLSPGSWLPEMTVVDEFVLKHGSYESLDSISQVFTLYQAHLKVEAEAEGFRDFLKWAPQVLVDFNDVDKYLVEAKSLFSLIHEQRKMEAWSPEKEPTALMSRYIKFYESLADLYKEYTRLLDEKKQGHQGYVLRQAAENADPFWEKVQEKSAHVWWAGFNALNQAEILLLKTGKSKLDLKFFWDFDEHYLKKEQEAGYFIRKMQDPELSGVFKNTLETSQDFKRKKKFTEVPVPKFASESTAAAEAVRKALEDGENPEDIALVLADEKLLEPILNQIPESVKKINITMGYPIRNTLPYRLIKQILYAQKNAEAKAGKGKNLVYYHKDVLRVLENPLLVGFPWAQMGMDQIKNSGKPYFTSNSLRRQVDGLPDFFPERVDLEKGLESLTLWLESWMQDQVQGNSPDGFGLEAGMQVLQMLNRLSDLVREYQAWLDLDSCFYLWQQLSQSFSVSFIGEPLQGLQVMGLLETRTLDFKHVILVSANEGKIPKGRSESPFIPFDTRREVNLPSFVEHDAVYAYHVYRLVQHADKVDFVYNVDGKKGAEPSRFIRQMRFEIGAAHQNIQWEVKPFQMDPLRLEEFKISIPKNEEMLKAQEEILNKRGLSPSAMATYFDCSLKYYFRYLAKIKEGVEIREELQADHFGTFVHDALEIAYSKMGAKVAAAEIDKILADPHEILAEAESKIEMDAAQLKLGINLLQMKLAKEQFFGFLEKEKSFVEAHELVYLGGEELLKREMRFGNLMGKADRIDKVDGVHRVVDYKTGSVSDKDLKFNPEKPDLKKSKALQLASYLLLVDGNREKYGIPQGAMLSAFIAPVKSSQDHYLPLEWGGNQVFGKEDLEEIKAFIEEQVEGALNDPSFEQTQNLNSCSYCEFAKPCLRQNTYKP